MADTYCSAKFKTGEELDAALEKALEADNCCKRAEEAAKRAEDVKMDTVLYTPQTLTEPEKAQARKNLGIKDEGVYELIREITVAEEDLAQIVVNNVLLKRVFVCIDSFDVRIAKAVQTIISDAVLGEIFNYTDAVCGTSTRLITKYFVNDDDGIVETIRVPPAHPAASVSPQYYTTLPKVCSGFNHVQLNATGYFAKGVKIYIYGVRA